MRPYSWPAGRRLSIPSSAHFCLKSSTCSGVFPGFSLGSEAIGLAKPDREIYPRANVFYAISSICELLPVEPGRTPSLLRQTRRRRETFIIRANRRQLSASTRTILAGDLSNRSPCSSGSRQASSATRRKFPRCSVHRCWCFQGRASLLHPLFLLTLRSSCLLLHLPCPTSFIRQAASR